MHPLTKLRVTLAMSLAPMALSQAEDVSLALNLMNQARQSHGLQPLQWDTNLAAYAQYWATEMAIGLVPFSHAQGQLRPQQGENIYEQQSTQCNAAYDKPLQTAMQSWLAEAAGYAGQPVATGTEPWLHWAQCLWSTTTHIGCAQAYSVLVPYQVFDVCRFYPEGNIIGQTPF